MSRNDLRPQAAATGTQRKILPRVKANGFEFRILELQSTQKVDSKRGPALQATWKVLSIHDTHVGAKNALAKLEEDERLFRTERADVTFFCGHAGSLDHKAPRDMGGVELANLRTAFALRNERATQMPCLKCFAEMVSVDASKKWHALLNAPTEWRQVEALPVCPSCKAKLGDHHAEGCAQSGQVLPSECPGYVERVAREVLAGKSA